MINFFAEDVDFPLNRRKTYATEAIKELLTSEGKKAGELNYIFCSDDYLLEVNKKYLNHDYYTDIITFDNTIGNRISGDMYISIDRVKENANNFNCAFDEELFRVIFHGVLHLCGYKDQSKEEELEMRKAENKYLGKMKT